MIPEPNEPGEPGEPDDSSDSGEPEEPAETSVIGVDWGTTSLRLYDVGVDEPIELLTEPLGIRQLPDGEEFGARLDDLLKANKIECDKLVMSGMITSQQGWVETPYVSTAATAADIAADACKIEDRGRAIWMMPGVSHRSKDGAIDFMRGEETQLVGVVDPEATEALFVLPGTHSKWVRTYSRAIVSFATFVTGELFELVGSHSIIAAVLEGDDPDDEAFNDGVTQALADAAGGSTLLHDLFTVRSRGLDDPDSRRGLRSYLSGVVIGAEIQEARTMFDIQSTILIVGATELADLYHRAFDIAGLSSEPAAPVAGALGLQRLAAELGLSDAF